MLIRFTKMHGLGNDFVMLDLISQELRLRPDQIEALSDRKLGIGFDQLLMAEPPTTPEADFRYRIYNADGSEAEQCGNGARCFLRFVRDRGLTTKTDIVLETNTGLIRCKLEKDGNITVDMGRPILQPEKIPFLAPVPQITYDLDIPPSALCNETQTINLAAISMGNPHAVIIVPSVIETQVPLLGPQIQQSDLFPQGVNVGFMEIVSASHIKLRVYERGVGETSACGSGACAAIVAGRLQGLLEETVTVSLTGGDLTLNWAGDNSSVMMTGPASRVYEGRLHI